MVARRGRRIGLAAACLFIGVLLLAPIMTHGECADSSDPGGSYCRTWQASVLGLETNVWVWLVGTAVLLAIVFGAAHLLRATRP